VRLCISIISIVAGHSVSLQIPSHFLKRLKSNSDKEVLVLNTIREAKSWLTQNTLYFFPEYTEHGFTHLNEVLLSASGLLTDEARNLLSSEDIAAITLSTVLHDCAMHLTSDGFYSLINGKYPTPKSRFVAGEKSWPEAWELFFDEAKKFNSKQLISMFGDSNPVTNIPMDKLSLTERDKLLIGEFIRRNHARLAHDIALQGIPGVDGKTVKLFSNSSDESFMDLCGFIARSHNMGLREAVDCFEPAKKRVHLKVHSPFIMLLLRIADYIQIHSERADKQLLDIKSIVSPASQGEWKKHHAIVEIIHAHEDPEAIFIDAEPEDAKTYIGLKTLFSDIQAELDRCWSVIGEIYGRYEEFRPLGINIRRVRSTLDDQKKYLEEKKPEFIPHLLSFRTSSAEMLELLVAPLYGNKPEIGIRELLQNSVDACKELKDSQVKQLLPAPEKDELADITISLIHKNNDNYVLVIKDNGIGMTLDIVKDYFLNVGASFRNSDYWRKNHINNGHSTVHRTGRFGIGLLAAYLLGDTLNVVTRHATEAFDKALSFTCKRGDTEIVVKHVEREVGTTITIDLDPTAAHRLIQRPDNWDWYGHKDIFVERKVILSERTIDLGQTYSLPSCNEESNIWSRTKHDEFDDVMWSYGDTKWSYSRNGFLFCNGIFVTSNIHGRSIKISPGLGYISCEIPNLIVFDQDGKLPLNLERDAINYSDFPFKEQLATDLSDRIVKELGKLIEPHKSGFNPALISDIVECNIKGLIDEVYFHDFTLSRFLISKNKAIPMDIDLVARNKPEIIIIDAPLSFEHGAWNSPSLENCSEYFIPTRVSTAGKGKRSNWIRTMFELDNDYLPPIGRLPIVGRRILISKSEEQRLVSASYVPVTFWRKLTKEVENEYWVMYCIGNVGDFEGDFDVITKHFEDTNQFSFIQYYLNWNNKPRLRQPELFNHFEKSWDKVNKLPYYSLC
jgi:molecular chaperone HtpG